MIPCGIAEGQDLSLDRVTVWIKFFDRLDGIIFLGIVVTKEADLNNKGIALLYRHGPPLRCL